MPNWKLKAALQKVISFLPYRQKINYAFQRYVTKGVLLTDPYFLDRLEHAQAHISNFQKNYDLSTLKHSLELGTGWHPIVPLSMFLVGLDRIVSIDLVSLTDKQKLHVTIMKFIEFHNSDRLRTFVPYKKERMEILLELFRDFDILSYEQILQRLHMEFSIQDASKLLYSEQSFQLIHSNNVFEHIYPPELENILHEFIRVLNRPKGVMSHFIDLSDHFAHFDKSITIYNFLKYSDAQWSCIDNVIQPQNRLRWSDYLDLFRKLSIPITSAEFRPGDAFQVKNLKLARKYQHLNAEALAISHGYMVSKF